MADETQGTIKALEKHALDLELEEDDMPLLEEEVLGNLDEGISSAQYSGGDGEKANPNNANDAGK